MQSGFAVFLLLGLLALAANAFVIPTFEFFGGAGDYNGGLAKRNFYGTNKREFNADDLTLRFGKRAREGKLAFSPDDLALRFGRK